jgi:two-component system, response regulator, stage 0 sporulation protein F
MSNKKTILYVDDERVNLQLFEFIFCSKYDVICAENGNKGLEILAENQGIDIVLSDMKMPQMDGLEFIRRSKEEHPKISHFLLTGFEITKQIQEALNTKLIQAYFQKPFNKGEIENELAKITA